MNRLLCFAILILSFNSSTLAQQPSFLSYPTLSPDGNIIVFSFDGDLWQVPSDGGTALRLTAMDGNEICPRISPDGQWLAFSSNQNGNMDVYMMPLKGGEIRQLTHHEAVDEVDSWSWDSKNIYFTSSRYNRFSSYKVNISGGTATRVFPHYFNYIHGMTETPSGELLFNNSWESYMAANRKRYKGSFNPDILGYSPKTKSFKQHTTYPGKDFWATVDKNGNIYFASDEGTDEYNLFTFNNGDRKALTRFKESIKRPFVCAQGNKIVFEKDYQLYLYDVSSGKVNQPAIQISISKVLNKEKEFNASGNISYFDVSPDGKKLAFVSRGELFISDIDGKFIRKMPSTGERIMEVKWMKDNLRVLFSQTWKGYQNWFIRRADGVAGTTQLSNDARNNRDISFNKTRSKAVYLSGRDEVRVMDLNTLKSTTIVKDEIWALYNSTPSFSPDDAYVLFTAMRNFEEDIFVYHFADKRTINLSNTGVSESNPCWSPDGKYIYFASNRTKPSYPMGAQQSKIYRLALNNDEEPFRMKKFDELFNDTVQTKKDTAAGKARKPAKLIKPNIVSIDIENLSDRISRVSPGAGTQSNPVIFSKADKTYIFFASDHEGKYSTYRITEEPFEERKTEKVADGGMAQLFDSNGKLYVLSGSSIQKYSLESNKLDKTAISTKFNRNLQSEFRQMFYETWAGIEENFYDSTFHGINWQSVKEKYERYLSGLNTRADLRVLLNDMLGELNASHLGFSTNGSEEQHPFNFVSNETGIIFDQNNPFKIDHVAANSPASHSNIDVKAGDLLVAVNGTRVDKNSDRDALFTSPSLMQELTLRVQRNGKEHDVSIRPITSAAFKDLLYDEWIRANRTKVRQFSNNRVAYTCMKNMGSSELNRFLQEMARDENNKEGLILDLRYNTGGNVHDEVLRFLSQRPYLQWQYREGQKAPQSNFGPAGKPLVLLINEQSLSDAEMTAAGFKALKLGTIVGTETYRWIIFTSAKQLVDGSTYRVPAWGCYTLDGNDLEMHGVSPDIDIKNTVEDRVKDEDPQLKKAVDIILRQL